MCHALYRGDISRTPPDWQKLFHSLFSYVIMPQQQKQRQGEAKERRRDGVKMAKRETGSGEKWNRRMTAYNCSGLRQWNGRLTKCQHERREENIKQQHQGRTAGAGWHKGPPEDLKYGQLWIRAVWHPPLCTYTHALFLSQIHTPDGPSGIKASPTQTQQI